MSATDNRAGLFLGIDVGTSGVRAIAVDAAGKTVAEARTALPASHRPAPGHSEQDPGDWWRATVDAVRRIPAADRDRVCALAVDGTSSSLLLCDEGGEPLTAALMYDDTRSTREAARIAAHAPADSPTNGAGSALAKLLRLRGELAGIGGVHALHQADWVAGRCRGRFDVSDENNCLKLGFDPQARRWPAWFAAVGVPATLLPEVVPVATPIGRVTRAAARELGLAPGTLVVSGTTDSNAATLAAGVHDRGDAVTSLGSTLVLKVLGDRPVSAARYGVYSHRIGDRWLIGGASNSGGAVLRRYFSDAELAALSETIDPQRPSGLDYYPLTQRGERFPIHDPGLAPRLSPRPGDPARFLHGLLEGMARIEALGYRRLAELGAPYPRSVLTSGGGAVNTTWQRIRARELGVPVHTARHAEAAYGTALLARRGAHTGPAA